MATRSEELLDEDGNPLSSGSTYIHVTALDGLINVNSLFTLAVFVGLAVTTPGQATLVDDSSCIAGEDIARNLLTFQVVSFSSFLFSSLVAQGLKQAIVLINSNTLHYVFKVPINKHFLRVGMLLSANGSVFGCIFLMLALMDVIQIKLGTLSCGSIWSIRAVVPLFISEELLYEPGNSLSEGSTDIHVAALDSLVNVNSLFTFSVFVGLTLTTRGAATLVDDSACIAGEDIARNLLIFQVVSFSSFLFSSLVAQGLKQAIVLINSNIPHDVFKAPINKHLLRIGIILSAFGSVFGCIFLMLALMDVIQIKLGILSCGSIWPIIAVVPLFMLVPTALVLYICIVLYAFYH